LIMFIFGYLSIHVIAIPFPQYRFLVEPLILILLSSLSVNLILSQEKIQPNYEHNRIAYFVNFIPITLLVIIFIPLIIPVKKCIVTYPANTDYNYPLSYDDLRELQWKNRGILPENTKAKIAGRIRYIAKGYSFVSNGISPAEKKENFAVGNLYVLENSALFPLGKGDVKLNFMGEKIPGENEWIVCYGAVRNGILRDILMDVDNWEKINEK